MGSYGVLWGLMGSYGLKGLYGVLWGRVGPYGVLWGLQALPIDIQHPDAGAAPPVPLQGPVEELEDPAEEATIEELGQGCYGVLWGPMGSYGVLLGSWGVLLGSYWGPGGSYGVLWGPMV